MKHCRHTGHTKLDHVFNDIYSVWISKYQHLKKKTSKKSRQNKIQLIDNVSQDKSQSIANLKSIIEIEISCELA